MMSQVCEYVSDTSHDAQLMVGPDMRKIQLCYHTLKVPYTISLPVVTGNVAANIGPTTAE